MKITDLPEWHALQTHQQAISTQHMRDWFEQDKHRVQRFSISCEEIFLDYSRNRIEPKTLALLIDLAHAASLPEKIQHLFAGQPLNITEKRPALHTALRDPNHTPIMVRGENIALKIAACQDRIKEIVTQIHQQTWLGSTGKPIAHVVNVGIGGSHLGPQMCCEALKSFATNHLTFHFISSVDKTNLLDVLGHVDPAATLFIISSKTFSTIETLTNAKTIIAWLTSHLGNKDLTNHFIAVTSAKEKAQAFGIAEENILPIWDWVGGRYSVWSAIGLPLRLMIGNRACDEFLLGAHQMDLHFKQAPFDKNMPVMMALLNIWYTNFFHSTVQAIIPYSHRLRRLPSYLQQADMESNGKSINLAGSNVTHHTGPVIFGEEGCNGQHAYHQLLLQGNHFIPVDFILINKPEYPHDIHHDILLASGLSQAQALMRGKNFQECLQELTGQNLSADEAKILAKHRMIPGNRPSNLILLNRLTPKNLGGLLALYEHKIFVQGVIWHINSFDQWGVELGKQLLPQILKYVQANQSNKSDNHFSALIEKVHTLT